MKFLSDEEVKATFGDPTPFLNEEGMPSIFWEEEILTKIDLPQPLPLAWDYSKQVSRISCHKKIAVHLRNALIDLYKDVQVWMTINDFGGVYNFRPQRRSKTLSRHCWGIAIDLDVGDNPFGKTPKIHPRTKAIFYHYGFLWGGDFRGSRQDGMHFEFADIARL